MYFNATNVSNHHLHVVLHREMKNVALFLGILALLLAVFSSASAALAGADDSNIRRLQSKGSKSSKGSKAPKGSKASKGSKACNVRAINDSYTTSDNEVKELNVLENDSFPDRDELAVNYTQPKDADGNEVGTLSFNSTEKEFEYSPDDEFVGELTFTYTIQDDECGSDMATVTINDSDSCFPAGSIVQVVREGKLVPEPIENLALGDEVKCVSEKTREVSTCTVFYHFHPSKDLSLIHI